MIAHLRGNVFQKENDSVVLDVGGVGYRVAVSLRTAEMLVLTSEAFLWIESITREDGTFLAGFVTEDEQDWFRILIGVPGVGMRVALNILSHLAPHELRNAILCGERAVLQGADGVGAKLAARLVTELREKAQRWALRDENTMTSSTKRHLSGTHTEALSALCALGYSEREVEVTLEDVLKNAPNASVEELVRLSLGHLARALLHG